MYYGFAQFIEDNIAAFKNLLWEDSGLFSVGGNNLMYLAAGHHLPNRIVIRLGTHHKKLIVFLLAWTVIRTEALKDAAEETLQLIGMRSKKSVWSPY